MQNEYYKNLVSEQINLLPDKNDVSIAMLVAWTQDKESDKEKMVVDLEMINTLGERINNHQLLSTLNYDEEVVDFIIDLFNAKEEKPERYLAFDIEVGHLWRGNKVIDAKVFLFKASERKLKILSCL